MHILCTPFDSLDVSNPDVDRAGRCTGRVAVQHVRIAMKDET